MSIAFFDVDGTLLPLPSLERRFFWNLLRRGTIPAANYFHWAAEMVGVGPSKRGAAIRSNKAYLRGLSVDVLSESVSPQNHSWIPVFLPAAVERIWWHAQKGHEVVLATGTLAPLAQIVAEALEHELLWRGVELRIAVIATELVVSDGCWTGEVRGVPAFAQGKALAVMEFANARRVSLSQCFAYGDHTLDRSMLEAIGNPFAVNPTPALRRIARQNGWPIVAWSPLPARTAAARHALQWKGEAPR